MTKKKVFYKIPEGFFEISKKMKDIKDLNQWVEHFRKKKIRTAIIQGDNKFILCRYGVESK